MARFKLMVRRSSLVKGPLFCIYLLLILSACGDGQNSAAPSAAVQASRDGSAAISLHWHSRNAESGYEIKALSDCSQEGVSHIKCNVYDDRETLLIEGDEWECAGRKGTLENIPAGQNRQFVCMGLDGGNIVHLGLIDNVTINAGEKTVVDDPIDLYPFATQLEAPEEGAEVSANRFAMTWANVTNAHQYRVQIATDRGFENIVEERTSTRATLTPGQLSPETTYYWRVSPEDPYGNQGLESGTRSFVTLPGAACHSPVLAPIENISVNAGDTVDFNLNATDQDNGDQLTFSFISAPVLPAEAQLDIATGHFTWPTTAADIGSYDITFSVQDNCEDGPLAVSEDVTLTVGDADGAICQPPELDAIGPLTLDENEFFALPLSAADPDTDPELLVYSAYDLPQGAQLQGRIFFWTPPSGSAGEYTVRFEVCDDCTPQQQCDDESVTLTVAAAQSTSQIQPPQLTSPESDTPVDNGCDLEFDPIEWTFEWSQVENANRYQLAVLQGTATVMERNTLTPRLTYTCHEGSTEISDCAIDPSQSADWSWRVRAGSLIGDEIQWSDWSEQRSLTFESVNTDCTEAAGEEILLPPDSLETDPTPLDNGCTYQYEEIRWNFSWSAVADAVSYEIEILQGVNSILREEIQSNQFVFTCDATSQTIAGCVIDDSEINTYSWRVRAIGADSRPSDWSQLMGLNIEAPDTDCQYDGEALPQN